MSLKIFIILSLSIIYVDCQLVGVPPPQVLPNPLEESCHLDWFGCPTYGCFEQWKRCGYAIHGAGTRRIKCCHSEGPKRVRICRYRSTYKKEYPTAAQGNWWDTFCLPIYPKYNKWD